MCYFLWTCIYFKNIGCLFMFEIYLCTWMTWMLQLIYVLFCIDMKLFVSFFFSFSLMSDILARDQLVFSYHIREMWHLLVLLNESTVSLCVSLLGRNFNLHEKFWSSFCICFKFLYMKFLEFFSYSFNFFGFVLLKIST